MNYLVRIPEPCHEDWNKMQPDEKGKFCHSCNKSVHDFTGKTDAEIHTILIENSDKKVCGHFRKSQVNRPLNLRFSIKDLPINLSRFNTFAIAVFFVFGTFLFSCTDTNGQTVGEIEMTELTTVGMIKPIYTDTIKKTDTINDVLTGELSCESNINIKGGISYQIEEPMVEGLTKVEIIEPVNLEKDYPILGAISYRVYPEDTIIPIVPNTQPDSIQQSEIKKIEKEFSLNVYPNPSVGHFKISYDVLQKGIVHIDIYNLNGAIIKNIVQAQIQNTGNYVIPTNLTDLPSGIYICKVINGEKEKSFQFVIAK
jgi:hypothetical protein